MTAKIKALIDKIRRIAGKKSAKIIAAAALAAAVIVFPLVIGQDLGYTVQIASMIGIYSILCVGLNITVGYTGLLDLGFIAFYAIGAYTAALLSVAGLDFWLTLPLAMAAGGAVRFALGFFTLKLRGDYLAIVTLAFGEIVRLVINNLSPVTNGPKGLPRVGEKMGAVGFFGLKFTGPEHYYYLIAAFLLLAIVVSYRLEHSRIGRALVAVREDELAAELSGVNVSRVKMVAFTTSGVFGALAGALYAYYVGFISPESFTFWESVFLVSMLVVGGMGNIGGVILGVVLLVGAPEALRGIGSGLVDYRMLFFGAVMIAVIIFRPQGIIPSKRRSLELHTLEKDDEHA